LGRTDTERSTFKEIRDEAVSATATPSLAQPCWVRAGPLGVTKISQRIFALTNFVLVVFDQQL